MQAFSFQQLGEKIKEIFISQEKYKFAKHIQEFVEGETFLGDYWTFYMFEPFGEKPPIMYSVLTPYDMVAKKAPEQALVFQDGKVILNIDCLEYVNMRTGIMDSLILKHMGVDSMKDKKILYFGTGNVAKMSLKALKEYFPHVEEVSVINKRGEDADFTLLGKELGVSLIFTSKESLGDFDYIFCHTSTGTGNVLLKEDVDRIKKGAVITTFVSDPGDTELAEEFYNTEKANIIIDWDESIDGTKELKSTIEKGSAVREKLTTLEKLFSGKYSPNPLAQYSVYRSTGTPMQNLAFLKLLLEKSS
ncbi:MAG TPA: hypothetical protein VEW42_04335 [Candidatus Eisenbacteria bacterium]|nr:hypothetical protein [Candidatus Eisenbacteria bacterium]